MSSTRTSFIIQLVLFVCIVAMFIGATIGLAFGIVNYRNYQPRSITATCNVVSCVTYEGNCSNSTCFNRTLQFDLDLDGIIYNATYNVTYESDPGICPMGNYRSPLDVPVVAGPVNVTCYYAPTNITSTLTLVPPYDGPPYDHTLSDAIALIVVCSILSFLSLLVMIYAWTVVRWSYQKYREERRIIASRDRSTV